MKKWADVKKERDEYVDPPHYTTLQPEPVDVIVGWGLPFLLGSAVKYIARAGCKDGELEGVAIRKAIRCLELYLERSPQFQVSIPEGESSMDTARMEIEALLVERSAKRRKGTR